MSQCSYQAPPTNTFTTVSITLHPPAPAEVMTHPPAAALPAATMTLPPQSPSQPSPVGRHHQLHLATSTPLANPGPSESPPLPSMEAAGVQQRLQFTHLLLCPVHQWYPVVNRRKHGRRVLWRTHPQSPSWERSRPLRSWIILPEPKECWNCRRPRMPR